MRKHYGRCSQESIRATSIHQPSMGSRRSLNLKAAKTLGLITIGFFVAVTPWTVTQLVMTLGKIKVHPLLDFGVTWLALSNSFWNVIIYCLTSTSFRLAAAKLFCRKQAEAKKCPKHFPRVELLRPRSTVLGESSEHIQSQVPDDWRVKNGNHVPNGYGECLSDKESSGSWIMRNKRHSSPCLHQRINTTVCIGNGKQPCHYVDTNMSCGCDQENMSDDSFHLSRSYRKKSPRLKDCLCHRSESSPNIPEFELFPLNQETLVNHSAVVLGGSSSSSDFEQ